MNKEDLVPGTLYIIKDSFFRKVKDPYLMCNRKGKGIRPEVFLFIEISNGLALMAPISSKKAKYDSIVKKLNKEVSTTNEENKKEEINNKLMGYYRSTVNGVSGYILLLDMFTIRSSYIHREYMSRDGVAASIDARETKTLIEQARKVYYLLKNGFKFVKTQPDFARIEQTMISEAKKNN